MNRFIIEGRVVDIMYYIYVVKVIVDNGGTYVIQFRKNDELPKVGWFVRVSGDMQRRTAKAGIGFDEIEYEYTEFNSDCLIVLEGDAEEASNEV